MPEAADAGFGTRVRLAAERNLACSCAGTAGSR